MAAVTATHSLVESSQLNHRIAKGVGKSRVAVQKKRPVATSNFETP